MDFLPLESRAAGRTSAPSVPPYLTACYPLRMANYLADGWGPRTIYIREEDQQPWTELETIAKAERRSVSYLLSEAVREYTSAHWIKQSKLRKLEEAEKAKAADST